jgi:hypothetical protein
LKALVIRSQKPELCKLNSVFKQHTDISVLGTSIWLLPQIGFREICKKIFRRISVLKVKDGFSKSSAADGIDPIKVVQNSYLYLRHWMM